MLKYEIANALSRNDGMVAREDEPDAQKDAQSLPLVGFLPSATKEKDRRKRERQRCVNMNEDSPHGEFRTERKERRIQ